MTSTQHLQTTISQSQKNTTTNTDNLLESDYQWFMRNQFHKVYVLHANTCHLMKPRNLQPKKWTQINTQCKELEKKNALLLQDDEWRSLQHSMLLLANTFHSQTYENIKVQTTFPTMPPDNFINTYFIFFHNQGCIFERISNPPLKG